MFNYHKSHTEKMKEYSVKHKTIHTFITCHYCQRNIDFLNDPAQNYIYGKEQYSSPHTKGTGDEKVLYIQDKECAQMVIFVYMYKIIIVVIFPTLIMK